MGKSDFEFIRQSIENAIHSLNIGNNQSVNDILILISNFCDLKITEIINMEEHERWLEEKRIQASIGTLNQ